MNVSAAILPHHSLVKVFVSGDANLILSESIQREIAYCDCLVHAAGSDDGAEHLYAVGGQLNETFAGRICKVSDT